LRLNRNLSRANQDGVVLKTSLMNEPVVCYPEEALDCFLRTEMDVLALGGFFVERKGG